MNPLLVVEGPADSRFLTDYVAEVFGQVLDEQHDFIRIGTDWRGLDNQKVHLKRHIDEDRLLLVVVDADKDTPRHDEGGFTKRNAAVVGWLQQHNVTAQVFLWPNHKDDGALEKMLLNATLPAHAAILSCFEKYEECLHASNATYITPDEKTKIYGYVQAIGVKKSESNETKRNYRNPQHWDLKAAGLQPLKDFLVPYFGGK